MCGRYTLATPDPADIRARFPVGEEIEIRRRYNVAPGDDVLAVTTDRDGAPRGELLRWGLVPTWAKDAKGGARLINARSETVAVKPSFRAAFARRRCLIPADGWYEWLRDGKRRRAYYMTPADGSPLAFAGLWSSWGPDGMLTCSIVTTAALGGLVRVHDRMPLALPPERWMSWLAGGDPDELLAPMSPAELAAIDIRPVGAAVGNVRNNGPELIEPAVLEPTLF
jgi:putative SOS response-associated peptidase YedK